MVSSKDIRQIKYMRNEKQIKSLTSLIWCKGKNHNWEGREGHLVLLSTNQSQRVAIHYFSTLLLYLVIYSSHPMSQCILNIFQHILDTKLTHWECFYFFCLQAIKILYIYRLYNAAALLKQAVRSGKLNAKSNLKSLKSC